MSLVVCLSGPAANAPQAKNALAGAGLVVENTTSNWGLPDNPIEIWTGKRDGNGNPVPGTGEWAIQPPAFATSFVTAVGADVNKAASVGQQFGFTLRSYWPQQSLPLVPQGIEIPGPDHEARIRELEERLGALEGVK